MKLSEVLKGLYENPDNTYEADIDAFKAIFSMKDGYFRFDVYYNDKLIAPELGGGGFNDNIHGSLDWRLVKKPVTWQEAIEAWLNGKPVTCKHSVSTYEYHNNSADSFAVMEDQDGNPPSRAEILEGTWYIEEESK